MGEEKPFIILGCSGRASRCKRLEPRGCLSPMSKRLQRVAAVSPDIFRVLQLFPPYTHTPRFLPDRHPHRALVLACRHRAGRAGRAAPPRRGGSPGDGEGRGGGGRGEGRRRGGGEGGGSGSPPLTSSTSPLQPFWVPESLGGGAPPLTHTHPAPALGGESRQPARRPVSQSVRQSVSQSVRLSVCPSVCQSPHRPRSGPLSSSPTETRGLQLETLWAADRNF